MQHLTRGLSVLALSFMASSAFAHGIYTAERHSDMAIVYGHGPSDEAYDNDKVKALQGHNAAGKALELSVDRSGNYVTFKPTDELVAISAQFDNGYWSEKSDGEWVNKPMNEVEDAKQGGHYLKYNTAYLKADDAEPSALGLDFEIVPMVNPLTLEPGDELKVQVLVQGEPTADIPVVAAFVTDRDSDVVKTDDDGYATLTIRNNGLNVVAAETSTELKDNPKADKASHFATLSFTFAADH